jgi:hypothetical protein
VIGRKNRMGKGHGADGAKAGGKSSGMLAGVCLGLVCRLAVSGEVVSTYRSRRVEPGGYMRSRQRPGGRAGPSHGSASPFAQIHFPLNPQERIPAVMIPTVRLWLLAAGLVKRDNHRPPRITPGQHLHPPLRRLGFSVLIRSQSVFGTITGGRNGGNDEGNSRRTEGW